MNKIIKNIFSRTLGYTLIELLAVIVIFVIVMSVIAGILYSSLRGIAKTRINNAVAQNGNYAISVFTDAVNNSDKVLSDSCSATPEAISSITFRETSENAVTFECDLLNHTMLMKSYTPMPVVPNPTPTPFLTINLVDGTEVKTYDAGVTPECYFKCFQDNVYSEPRIEFGFSLNQISGDMFEKKATGDFRSTQSFRNYNTR